jgi:ABC-2 type transport system permease protein
MGYHLAGGFGAVLAAGLLVIACSWAISWIFAFFGVIARTASSVQGISMLILFPLTSPVERVRADRLAARTARLVRECEPDLSPRDRGARSRERGGHRRGLWASFLGAAVIVLVFAPLTVRAYMRKA